MTKGPIVKPLSSQALMPRATINDMSRTVTVYPTEDVAKQELSIFAAANEVTFRQIDETGEQQERDYRMRTNANQRIAMEQLKRIEEGKQRSFIDPELFHLPEDELDNAVAGAGEGLTVYSVVHLMAIERAGKRLFSFNHEERPPDIMPRYSKTGFHESMPLLVQELDQRMVKLEQIYIGVRIIPIPFTVEEETIVANDFERQMHTYVDMHNATELGIQEFLRTLEGISITESPSDTKFTGFTPKERQEFLRLRASKMIIDV